MKIERFELNAQEKDSAVWKKLQIHLLTRLEMLRKQNDGDLSAEETARQRGKIAMLKELLGFNPVSVTDRQAGGV